MSEYRTPIGAVSRLTGLTADSLRAWERRYGAIQPKHVKGGRLYSDSDIHRLKLLKQAVDRGHAISKIAALDDVALEKLPIRRNKKAAELAATDMGALDREVRAILDLIIEYDVNGADQILGKLATLMPPRDFVYELVVPLMHRVGVLWHSGQFKIAHEHLVSALLRNVLGTLIRLHTRQGRGRRIMFTTTSGELHEFGILVAAMLAAIAGAHCVYLGPNLPVGEITRAAKEAEVKAVCIAMVNPEYECQRKSLIKQLRDGLPAKISLIVGCSVPQVHSPKDKLWVFENFRAFDKWLEKHIAG